MPNPLTNQEYVAAHGAKCPFCRAEDTEGDSFEHEAGVVWQEVWCNACKESWQDTYHLVSYTQEFNENTIN